MNPSAVGKMAQSLLCTVEVQEWVRSSCSGRESRAADVLLLFIRDLFFCDLGKFEYLKSARLAFLSLWSKSRTKISDEAGVGVASHRQEIRFRESD